MPESTGKEYWEDWTRRVDYFEGKSKVIKLLQPLLTGRNHAGRVVRRWFESGLPRPTSAKLFELEKGQLLTAAADRLLPFVVQVYKKTNTSQPLVVVVRDAHPDANPAEVSKFSGSHGRGPDRRARLVRDQAIRRMYENPRLRAKVLGGEPFPHGDLAQFDELAKIELAAMFGELQEVDQMLAGITRPEAIKAIGSDKGAIEPDAVLEKAKQLLYTGVGNWFTARANAEWSIVYPDAVLDEPEFIVPKDINQFLARLVTLELRPREFSEETALLWETWVAQGTVWIDEHLQDDRKISETHHLYVHAAAQAYDSATKGYFAFLTRIDLGLAQTTPDDFEKWARKKIRWSSGGALGYRNSPPRAQNTTPPKPDQDVAVGADGSPVLSAEMRLVLAQEASDRVLDTMQLLPGLMSDTEYEALARWFIDEAATTAPLVLTLTLMSQAGEQPAAGNDPIAEFADAYIAVAEPDDVATFRVSLLAVLERCFGIHRD